MGIDSSRRARSPNGGGESGTAGASPPFHIQPGMHDGLIRPICDRCGTMLYRAFPIDAGPQDGSHSRRGGDHGLSCRRVFVPDPQGKEHGWVDVPGGTAVEDVLMREREKWRAKFAIVLRAAIS